MENLNRFLSISAVAVLLSACQAQYKTTDDPSKQRNNTTPAVTPTPPPASTSRTPEPIRNPTRGGGVQNTDRSTVRTQPIRRDTPVTNPGGGEWGLPERTVPSGTASGSGASRLPPTSAPAADRTSGPDRPITTVVVRDSREQVVTVAAGSGGQGGPCLCQDLTLHQPNILTNKIDLLFVIDPKVAVKDREDIANSVLDHVPQGIDYRVAVLPAYSSASALSGALYAPANEEKVLNTSATDKAAAMSWSTIRNTLRDRIVNLPLEASNAKPNERGLTALSRAIDADGNHFYNFAMGGMNRQGAALAIIIVGDINDEKDFKTAELLARLKVIKRDMPVTINGFFSQPSISANQRGYGYLEAIRLAHGHSVHMTRINEGLTDIGENILFNLYSVIQIPLQYRNHYNGEEITVSVDGVKHSKNIGYYDQQTAKYHLHTVGRASSRIRIEFCK